MNEGQGASHAHDHNRHALADAGTAAVKDPVCGMSVDPATSRHRFDHGGTVFHFCSAGCRTKFETDPNKYLAPKEPETAPSGAIYTCPMHPQIRQIGPGSCPICGMALEPVAITAEAEANPELVDMTRRFWISVVLTVPVFVLEMGGHVPWLGLHRFISPGVANWVELVLATPVVLWGGAPFFARGWNSLVLRSLNMFTLIALGTGASWLYSIVATLAPGIFPDGFRGMGGSVAVYFFKAAAITVLVLLGQVLELRARAQTGGAIRALLNLAPKTAHRLRDNAPDEAIPLADVHPGDRLRVRPGDGVPVDGTVLH